MLNLATMQLIKNTSALTLNVSGVFKDVGLILWSVVVSGAVVTKLQYVGYAVVIVGVSAYSAYKRAQQQATPPAAGSDLQRSSAAASEEAQPLAQVEPPSASEPTASMSR